MAELLKMKDLTKREYFAILALQGEIAAKIDIPEENVKMAIWYADELIEKLRTIREGVMHVRLTEAQIQSLEEDAECPRCSAAFIQYVAEPFGLYSCTNCYYSVEEKFLRLQGVL